MAAPQLAAAPQRAPLYTGRCATVGGAHGSGRRRGVAAGYGRRRGAPLAAKGSRRQGLLALSAVSAAAFQDVDPSAAREAAEGGAAGGGQQREALPVDVPPLVVQSHGRRTVAIGDLHGDWPQAMRALALAGVISEQDAASASNEGGPSSGAFPPWAGGDTLLVQVGDILDRGDDELRLLSLFASLKKQAQEAGGDVFVLHGNHEAMNVMGDFRYVTLGGFREVALYMEETEGPREGDPWTLNAAAEARFALFAPGGPVAMQLASNPTVLQVDDTLFAHAGVLPQHVEYGLERVNYDMASWMSGMGALPGQVINGEGGVYWTRVYGRDGNTDICNGLSQVLDATGAERMVVGHTPQEGGANAACDGRVWRIDVGMSRGIFSGTPQVLEIVPPRPDANGDGAAGDNTETQVRVLAATPTMGGKPRDDNW